MTISTYDSWAETEWNAGRLTYNGLGTGDLGSWAAVTASGGLGGGANFSFDSGTNTLSLVSVPEPGSFALLTAAGVVLLARRRH
jgi:hypothetical protein